MSLLFGLTLFYPVIVAAAGVALYHWPLWLSAVVAVALSSLWWAHGPAKQVTHSRILNAWRSYFRLQVWREESPVAAGTLFVALPHGLFPMGLPLLSGPVIGEVYPELREPRAGVASVFFWIPLLAPLVTWLGGIPARRTELQELLRSGRSCLLFPDGIAGAFRVTGGGGTNDVLRISGRSGFETLARSVGAPIVPVYCFGHSQLWSWSWPPAGHYLERLSRRLRMAFVWYWPIVPRGRIDVVFGAPLKEGETFAAAITALHERHKERLGHGHRGLMISH